MATRNIFLYCGIAFLSLFGRTTAETVTCIYESWSGVRGPYGVLLGDQLPAELCTHVVYTYASIYNDKIFNQMPALDEAANGGTGNIAKFVSLKESNPSLKALIGVGGWSAGGWIFSNMVATPEGRQTFIQSVIDFCAVYGLDGVFLDWLYPGVPVRGGSPDDAVNYASLLSEMKTAFEDAATASKTSRLFIGVTVSPSPDYLVNYDPSELNSAADLVYVITYDLAGYWNGSILHPSPLFLENGGLSVDLAVQMWLNAGISADKLVIGIPTFARTYKFPENRTGDVYGETFNGDGLRGPVTSAPGFLIYSEACSRIQLGNYTVVRNASMKVPYAYSTDQLIMYDDEISVKEKANYAKKNRLSGVYIFSVDQDDVKGFCGSSFPLTRAAASVLIPSSAAQARSFQVSQVQYESRCISTTKECRQKVRCLRFVNPANNSTDYCTKNKTCVQPDSIVECPIPDKLGGTGKRGLFAKGAAKTQSNVVFLGGPGGSSSMTAVRCRAGVTGVMSPGAGKDGASVYTCLDSGVLGRSVQEFNCPAGSKYSTMHLKCVVGSS